MLVKCPLENKIYETQKVEIHEGKLLKKRVKYLDICPACGQVHKEYKEK